MALPQRAVPSRRSRRARTRSCPSGPRGLPRRSRTHPRCAHRCTAKNCIRLRSSLRVIADLPRGGRRPLRASTLRALLAFTHRSRQRGIESTMPSKLRRACDGRPPRTVRGARGRCLRERFSRLGDSLVEEVAHRVDEDHPRARPLQRLLQSLWPELQRKTLLVRMPRDATPALGERLCITVRAARRDLVAARHWIPGRLSPLNCAVISQGGYSFGFV